MRVIDPSIDIIFLPDGGQLMKLIESAGRTCYKSEDLTTDDSADGFVRRIIASGHHSVIEHANISVRFVCDRGVTHELVRHRLAAFSQESTRYANYAKDKFGNEITVIKPMFWDEQSAEYKAWYEAMVSAEKAYMALLDSGAKAQEARSVLPNSLKTEIVMTANLREWRHVINLRCGKPSHPQIRQIMLPLLAELNSKLPVIFSDLYEKYNEDIANFAQNAPVAKV